VTPDPRPADYGDGVTLEVGLFVAPQLGASYDDQLAVARAAEANGFFAFVRSDHYLPPPGFSGLPGPTDAWITLAGLARDTSVIRLGTMVSPVTFRLPGPLAIGVAQVDAMSNGRVMLGLGAGWMESEHRAYGIPFRNPTERFERLEEQLIIVRGLWTTPNLQTFDFDGRWYKLEACPALPKPSQFPHPPIVIGGQGLSKTPRLAARYADEVNVSPPDPMRCAKEFFRRVDAECHDIGRDPVTLRRSVTITVLCGSATADLRRRRAAIPGPIGEPDIAGTPQQIADELLRFTEFGVNRAYLRVADLHDVEHVELLGRELLPLLRRS